MKTVIRNSYTPKIGDYCETIVVDKETENGYIFDCDGVFTEIPQPVDVEAIIKAANDYTDEVAATKVDKEPGKGLSTNDYTDADKAKLEGVEAGAQVNKIETITQNGTPLTITDKTVNVTVPTKTSDLANDGSDGTDTYVESATLNDYYTKSETDTQIGYETTAREIADAGLQEQIDAIAASSDVVDIVGTYAALQAYDTTKLHDNDIIKVLDDETRDDATTYYRWDKDTSTWSYIGAEGPFYTKAETDATFVPQTRTVNGKALSSNISLTATDVGALPDSTVIPTVNDATLTIQKNGVDVQTFTANQASNATANITVPTATSDITNDSGFITASDIPTDVSAFNNDAGYLTTVSWSDVTDKPTFAAVATSGAYSDLSGTPTNVSDFNNDAGYLTSVSWDDIGDKPTIPTVNNGTLTIQKNGTQVATFTANQSGNATANITVPTKTSDLNNDSGFIANSALSNYYTKSETYSQNEVNSLINTITIPTKTSDLTNDGSDGTSTYVEADDLAASYQPKLTAGSNITISGNTISATDTTYSDFTGATSSTAGAHGLVPAPSAGDEGKFLKADGTWATGGATYSAGTGIDITNNVISADTTTLATKTDLDSKQDTLTAGSNMDITNNVISAKVDSALSVSSTNPVQNSVVTAAINGKADTSSLATVATSGSYNDLSNKPTIPTVNDATLTIQKNGVTVETFTANASTNKTANITVPTKTSDLTNDSGFIVNDTHQVCGEGSNITLDTTTFEPLEVNALKGNTEQNGTPTPSAPVPVQTVTGYNEVKICSKNLISDETTGTITWSGTTVTFSEDKITINKTGTGEISAAARTNAVYMPIKANQSYAFSLSYSSGSIIATEATANWIFYLYGVNKDGSTSSSDRWTLSLPRAEASPSNNVVFTPTKDYIGYKLGCYIPSVSPKTSGDVVINAQLELGNQATAYQAYTGQSYEVNLGKNLFDKNNTSGLFEGYVSGTKAWATSGYWSYYIPCQPNTTYTASRTNIGNGGRFAIATSQVVPANNVDIAQLTQDNAATSLTITTDSSAKYIIVWFANVNDAGSESLADWKAVQQLEKGSQATSYAAYFTPIELCKIGDYQDYIWNDNGTWKIHKEVGKAIVDGSTGVWGKPSSNRFNVDALITGYKRSDTIALSLCDRYLTLRGTNDNVSFNTIAANYNYCINFGSNTAYSNLRFKNTDYDDLDVFKTALSASPVTIYYALATPTDTEITNAALVAQLNALWDADGYEGQTNIALTCAEGNAQGILSVCQYPSHLPIATTSKLGTVIVGHNLTIGEDGRLDANVNNGKLTVSQNGISAGTFFANQPTDSTIDIDTHYDKIYEYVQETTSSSSFNIDVPIDFSEYYEFYYEFAQEPESAVSTSALRGVNLVDASDNNIQCERVGMWMNGENGDTTIHGDSTTSDAIGVAGTYGDYLAYISGTIVSTKTHVGEWPVFSSRGYGYLYFSLYQGRVGTQPQNIKKLRFNMRHPKAGSWITIYGKKRS